MKKTVLFFLIPIAFAPLFCCSGNHGSKSTQPSRDTIIIHDTIFELLRNYIIVASPEFDSLQTQKIMEECIWKNYIDVPNDVNMNTTPDIYASTNLEHLPYYMLNYSNPVNVLNGCNGNLILNFINLCTGSIDDPKLYMFGKQCINMINAAEKKKKPYVVTRKDGKKVTIPPNQYKYPDSFKPASVHRLYSDYEDYDLVNVDTLRLKALIYNDRGALKELEKYYKKKGDDKGIAIYYKVMLGYKGNGDLAEKFYRVLEPYFDETPEFRSAVREVLLRAAHCDNDRRAKELCDSLGFSFCDYRLPLPAEMNSKERPKSVLK